MMCYYRPDGGHAAAIATTTYYLMSQSVARQLFANVAVLFGDKNVTSHHFDLFFFWKMEKLSVGLQLRPLNKCLVYSTRPSTSSRTINLLMDTRRKSLLERNFYINILQNQ